MRHVIGWVAALGVGLAGAEQAGAEEFAQALTPTAPAAAPSAGPPLQFATSGDAAFDAWRRDFAQRAVAQGRSPNVVQQLLADLRPDPSVIALDQNQAEFVRPVWDYVERAVSPDRVARGASLRTQYAQIFSEVQRRYGVDADIVAGIWAMETEYGTVPLTYSAPAAIATLAAQGRRREQFEKYFLALIEMVEKGYAGPVQLRSSWAGALGQPQFMPDAYLTTAVDFDNDGKRDIWTNPGDSLASIANYLAAHGWRRGEPVYDEVLLPRDMDFAVSDGTDRPISFWVSQGVRSASGYDYSPAVMSMTASLYLPAGAEGPAFLLFPNFAVIRTYNKSDRYALGVGLLARSFETGRYRLASAWPRHLGSLNRDQLLRLQDALNRKGFSAGETDGMFGTNTRAAVRRYQQSEGLPADGYPTPALLTRIDASYAAERRSADQRTSPELGRSGIIQLQRAFNRLGTLRAQPTGTIGPATTAAIQRLERQLGLEPTGRGTEFILAKAQAKAANVRAPTKARPAAKKAKAKAKKKKRRR
jgi:lytic murein transglycosylase